jgi:ferredoxin-type protein NapF
VTLSRRQFLSPGSPSHTHQLYPPWANIEQFESLCDRCGNCMDSCPNNLLEASSTGYPEPMFSKAWCDFCGECAAVCRTKALDRSVSNEPWSLIANIDSYSCLAWNRIDCRSCVDFCPLSALQIHYRVGSVPVPMVDADKCSGCGACVAPCPVSVITIKRIFS